MVYAFECSSDYNLAPLLSRIKAPLYAINSADDEVNPPELGILEREIVNLDGPARGAEQPINVAVRTISHDRAE